MNSNILSKLSHALATAMLAFFASAGSFTQYTLLSVASGPTPKAVLEDSGKTLRLVYDSKDYGEEDADWFPIKTGYLNVNGISRSNAILYGSIRELDAYLYVYSLEKIVVDPSFSSYTPTQAFGWFAGFPELTTIEGMANFNTSQVTDMSYMFCENPKLQTVDFTGFDTSHAVNLSYAFYNCSVLSELDLTSFDTSRVKTMSCMFAFCSGLSSVDLSSFDTSVVQSMAEMFYGCSSLTELDLSGFDTSLVTSMNGMFSSCRKLETVYASERFAAVPASSSPTYAFDNCQMLVGGAETAYGSSRRTVDYAHLDEPDNPGYFTQKSGRTPHGILFVDGSTGSDSNEGQTSSNPKKTIADALSAIAEGGRIYVSTGVYPPISTANKNVSIIGWERTGSVVIDGGNSQRCAYLGGSTNECATVLRRFTLRNGKTNSSDGAGVCGGTVECCVISNCQVSGSWGGFGYSGGGAAFSRLSDCTIANCKALSGGGVSRVIADRCVIRDCYAYDDGGGSWNQSVLYNCLIYGNYAYNCGGGGSGSGCCECTAYNCTIANNNARAGGGVAGANLYNCIVYNNSSVNIYSNGSDKPSILYNCCTSDPSFRDAANGDYRLAYGSPCVDAGDNTHVTSSCDLAGRQRIDNAVVDIGCYELRDYLKALDFTGSAVFNDNLDSDWLIDTNEWERGGSSMRTAPIGHSGDTRIHVTLSGSGLLTFDWKVESERGCDILWCYVDGVPRKMRTENDDDWTSVSIYLESDGEHTVEWRYTKDGSVVYGRDCGWIDHLVWSPGADNPHPGVYSRVENRVEWVYRVKDGYAVMGGGCADLPAVAYSVYGNDSLPYSLDGYVVREIGDFAFYQCSTMSRVSLPSGVVRIGASAFEQCVSLTDLTLPTTVKELGDSAFSRCESLLSFVMPASVESCGTNLLSGCSRLQDVVVHSPLANALSFSDCPNLESIWYDGAVSIPEGSYGALSGAVLYVPRDSTGWGCEIPGKWCGLDIDYLENMTTYQLSALDVGGGETFVDENLPRWSVDASQSYFGGSSLQSARISHGQSTFVTYAVEGKGTLSFYWKTSSEGSCDCLRCYVDDVEYGRISGMTDWQNVSLDIASEGTHEIKWEYRKDGSVSYGSDCGWIDRVVWTPGVGTLGRDVLLWAPSVNSDDVSVRELVPKLLNVLQDAYQNRIPGDERFASSYPAGISVDCCRYSALPGYLSKYALVFVVLPHNSISEDDVARLKTVVARGGRVVLQAEHALFSGTENARLTTFAADMGADFAIADGQKAGSDSWNMSCDLLEKGIAELPESKSVAPITYSGKSQLVAALSNDTSYVWAVDEASSHGRITVFSDNNWYCDSSSSSGTLYAKSIPLLERLLSNAMANEQAYLDEDDINDDIGEKIPDGCNVAVKDDNGLLTYYTNIWEACAYASDGKDITNRWTVILKKSYYEDFELPEGVTFETTTVTSNYTDYATISAPSQCEITTNATRDIFRCVSVNAPAAPVVTASDATYTNRIVVSWTVPESDKPITGYTIQRERKDNHFKQDPVVVTTNLYVDTDARPGVRYVYHVYAMSSAGNGESGSAEGLRSVSASAGVADVTARQRYPWNGKVDVDFRVTGDADVTYRVGLTVTDVIGGTNLPVRTVLGETLVSPGRHRLVWDADADIAADGELPRLKVSVTAEEE